MEVIPFDLHRIFIGDLPHLFLLEIVFRTLFMFVYTLIAVRFLGKRGTGQLTVFDFIVVMLLGSAAGDPMFYDDVPLLHAMVVITVVVLIERALNSWTNRNPRIEQVIESKAVKLISDGKIIDQALRSEEISRQELMMELRLAGIKDTGEVMCAYMEPSGRVSIFKNEDGGAKTVESTFPDV